MPIEGRFRRPVQRAGRTEAARLTSGARRRIVNGGAAPAGASGVSEYGNMERETCTGTRKGKECGGPVFKCGNCGALGCEKSGCDSRQFTPIERCKDCGHSYERIKQFKPSRAPGEGAGSTVPGRPIALPNVELLFGGVLALVVLGAAIAGVMGVFNGGVFNGPKPSSGGSAVAAPPASGAVALAPVGQAFTDICQCYREGGALAGTGVSVLSSQYRTGFVQCRAVFGVAGGDAWTAGWNARSQGKLIGAGCRSWLKGLGR